MKQIDASELERVITELDALLINGFNRYQVFTEDYHERAPKPDFNLEEYTKEKLGNINEWYPQVYKILNENFQLKHHLFHFVNPKLPPGISVIGLPDKVGELSIKFRYYLYALEDIILRLDELKNLAIRQEIAEKEYQADILYRITYSEHTREIKLNNILLAHPNSDSKAVNFFEFVFQQPNTPIDVAKIEESAGQDLSDNVHDILRDLGFTGSTRQIFFPVATKKKVMFTNPISKQYAIKNDLPIIDFTKLTRQSEKEREETS